MGEKGLYVIRFDNRDVGLSTKMEEAGVPDPRAAMTARMKGEKVDALIPTTWQTTLSASGRA
jgi:hypothetical protein